MTSPAFLSQPTSQRIPVLLEDVRTRRLELPNFHRRFVWGDEQRVELMRSINEGLPLGSLLVWRTQIPLDTHTLPGVADASLALGELHQYVLDGHQRVITLFTTLHPGRPEMEDIDTPILPELHPIYFDLDDEDFRLGTSRNHYVPTHWLPLEVIFSTYRFYEFLKTLGSRTLGDRAEQLILRFKDYAIPIIPLVTDDIEVAVRSFQRINSTGTAWSQADMVRAISGPGSQGVGERLERIRTSIDDQGWTGLDEQAVLDVCKGRSGLDIYTAAIDALILRVEADPTILDDVETALRVACEFLATDCDVFGAQTLPYARQLVLLANALVDVGVDELEKAKAVLFNWFWATTYAGYFVGMSSARLRQATEHLLGAVAGNEHFLPSDLTTEVRPPGRFSFRAARSKAIALGMADLWPTDPAGTQYPAHQLLAIHGGAAMPRLVVDRGILPHIAEGFENRFIAAPGDARLLRERLLSPVHDPDVKESHGIDRHATELLRRGDLNGFLQRRREIYLAEERRFAQELGLEYREG